MVEVKSEPSIKLNRLESAISTVAPRWAAQRLSDKAGLEASRIMLSYGAAYPSTYRERAWGPLVTEEAELQGYSRFQLMLDSRDLYRNFPIMRAGVNGIARRAVASGIHPEFSTDDEDWNAEASEQWKSWCEICDLSGKMDLDGVCRQAIRSCYTDGDLGIGLVDEDSDLRLQLIEGDRIAENQRAGIQIDTINPIGGINVDWRTGRPTSYLVGQRGMGGILNTNSNQPWPAESFILLYRPQRVDQVRGVPLLAPVIQTARDLDRYITATRIQANIAATFGVVIKRNGAAQVMMRESAAVSGSSTLRTAPMSAMGKFTYLNPGEEIESFGGKGNIAPEFDDFSKFMIRQIAIGMGTTYESMMNDFTNMSFSSSMTHLMDFEMIRAEWQRWLIRKFLYRAYCVWVSKRMSAGALAFNEQAYRFITWRKPRPIYANPSDEASNTNLRLQAGTTTYQHVYEEQEQNWKVELRKRAEAQAYIKELSEEFSIEPHEIAFAGIPGMMDAGGEDEEGKDGEDKKKKTAKKSGDEEED